MNFLTMLVIQLLGTWILQPLSIPQTTILFVLCICWVAYGDIRGRQVLLDDQAEERRGREAANAEGVQ